MTREEIHERVATMMSQMFDIEKNKITLDARFEDLDLTSLDAIDLVVELQQLTGSKVNEEGLRKVRTVGDIVGLVQAHLEAAKKA